MVSELQFIGENFFFLQSIYPKIKIRFSSSSKPICAFAICSFSFRIIELPLHRRVFVLVSCLDWSSFKVSCRSSSLFFVKKNSRFVSAASIAQLLWKQETACALLHIVQPVLPPCRKHQVVHQGCRRQATKGLKQYKKIAELFCLPPSRVFVRSTPLSLAAHLRRLGQAAPATLARPSACASFGLCRLGFVRPSDQRED